MASDHIIANFFFSLYYVVVATYWIVKIMHTLGAKAIMRSLSEPQRAKRFFALVYVWDIVYSTLAYAGFVTLTDNVLGYDAPWFLLVCALMWSVYVLNNLIGLGRLPFENMEAHIRAMQPQVEEIKITGMIAFLSILLALLVAILGWMVLPFLGTLIVLPVLGLFGLINKRLGYLVGRYFLVGLHSMSRYS